MTEEGMSISEISLFTGVPPSYKQLGQSARTARVISVAGRARLAALMGHGTVHVVTIVAK
jgi:hypothetical protein